MSSRRVRVNGAVGGVPVTGITVDTATDVCVISHPWLQSHPTLRSTPLHPVPPAAVSLRAANGMPINVLGFIGFPLTLGGITRTVTALVVPSLGPDSVLLDNSVMSDFGATLDWENQILSFSSTGTQIPAIHRRISTPPIAENLSPPPRDENMSVAAIHRDSEEIPVYLRERVDMKHEFEALAVAYTDCLPPEDCSVVVEPRIVSETDLSQDGTLAPFENIIVARTLATWHASDGSVVVQICNPSSDNVCLPDGLCLGKLSTVSVVSPDQLHVNAVANTHVTGEEVRKARSELKVPCPKRSQTQPSPRTNATLSSTCVQNIVPSFPCLCLN